MLKFGSDVDPRVREDDDSLLKLDPRVRGDDNESWILASARMTTVAYSQQLHHHG
jgi:hypothetical protein